jgi:hypothetical protein
MYYDNTKLFEHKDVKYTVFYNNRIIIFASYLTFGVIESKIVNVCSDMHFKPDSCFNKECF